MELSEQQRQAISDHCLPTSWQMLSAWRLRNLGSLNDGPDVLVDWLSNADPAAHALVQEMLRFLGDRLWRIELHPAQAAASANPAGLRAVDVLCGGLRWTLWLQPRPTLHLVRISR
jgi:hypothetical protein